MITLQDLRIDPEFEKIIPPLQEEEVRQLEDNILKDGEVYTPLFTWNGLIIDGHHRYKILRDHPDIIYRIVEKQFENRYAVLAWICNNQLGRRNLTPEQRKYLIGKRYESEKKSNGAVEAFRGNQYSKVVGDQIGHLPLPEKTRKRIAKETNTSEGYVERAGKYAKGIEAAEEVLPGIKRELLSGTVKPTEKAVSAIASASKEDRLALAKALRLPKERKKETHSPEPEQVSTIANIETSVDASEIPAVSEEDILHTMSGAADVFIATCENHFSYFPKLLSEDKYLKKVKTIMSRPHEYITKKIKEIANGHNEYPL